MEGSGEGGQGREGRFKEVCSQASHPCGPLGPIPAGKFEEMAQSDHAQEIVQELAKLDSNS